jgi:hypothetical protein
MAYWTFAFLRKWLKYENLMDADDSYNKLTVIKCNTVIYSCIVYVGQKHTRACVVLLFKYADYK